MGIREGRASRRRAVRVGAGAAAMTPRTLLFAAAPKARCHWLSNPKASKRWQLLLGTSLSVAGGPPLAPALLGTV
eukprot:scaffold20725_cov111-Isochrysis_galbana.AAC.5